MLFSNQKKGILVNIILLSLFLSAEAEAESLPVCNSQSGTTLLNHSDQEAKSGETSADQVNGVSKYPSLLREVNQDLLQSGKLQLTGKCLSGIKIKMTHLCFLLLYKRGENPGYEQCHLSVVAETLSSAL